MWNCWHHIHYFSQAVPKTCKTLRAYNQYYSNQPECLAHWQWKIFVGANAPKQLNNSVPTSSADKPNNNNNATDKVISINTGKVLSGQKIIEASPTAIKTIQSKNITISKTVTTGGGSMITTTSRQGEPCLYIFSHLELWFWNLVLPVYIRLLLWHWYMGRQPVCSIRLIPLTRSSDIIKMKQSHWTRMCYGKSRHLCELNARLYGVVNSRGTWRFPPHLRQFVKSQARQFVMS